MSANTRRVYDTSQSRKYGMDVKIRWMVVTIYFGFIIINVMGKGNFLRRRTPVTVDNPEFIRLSTDPNVKDSEKRTAVLKGKNVCVRRKLIKRVFETICEKMPQKCNRHSSAYIWQFHTIYKCCKGFEAVKGKPGCPKDKYSSKDNIIQVAKQLGLTTFVELLQRTFLHWTLRASHLLTVFIPTNDALKNFFTTTAGVEVLKDNYKLRVFILMHVVGGKWPTHFMRGRKRLECILPGKWRELNLQFYGKVLSIQNALVIKADQPASNGMVHVIDDVITQSRGSLSLILRETSQFSIFNQGLQAIGYKLKGLNTIFVPSDQAFRKRGIKSLNDLKRSFKCLKEFLETHVLPGLMFLSILKRTAPIRVTNSLGKRYYLGNYGGHIKVNNMVIKTRYIGARDGAIFVIDRLLISAKALSIVSLLQRFSTMSKVAELFKRTQFEENILRANETYTLFLPSNRAISNMPLSDLNKLKSNASAINFLMDHIAYGKYSSRKWGNNFALTSLNDDTIRINKLLRTKICAGGEKLSFRYRDLPACNVMINVLYSHVLKPSKYSMLDHIKNDSRFSMLQMVLRMTLMNETLEKKAPLTFFAPTNDAWAKLDNKTLMTLFSDIDHLKEVIKYHTLRGTFYSCNVLWSKMSPYAMTGRRVRISLKTGFSHAIKFNYATTIEQNINTRNGVLHIIDDVVLYLYKSRYDG